jgi:hypothetical protein
LKYSETLKLNPSPSHTQPKKKKEQNFKSKSLEGESKERKKNTKVTVLDISFRKYFKYKGGRGILREKKV